MEETNIQQPQQVQQPKTLPNSTAVLVLGILSIVLCWCYGIPGIVLSIIALVLAKKDLVLYNIAPSDYSTGSLSNLKAGKVCAIVGLCLSGLTAIYFAIYLMFFGAVLTSVPWEMLNSGQF